MKAIQVGAEERKRFLAAVQNVTNRSFPKLCEADRLQLVYPRFMKSDGSTPPLAWIPAETKDAASAIAPLNPLSASETTVKNLSNLAQAAPDELITSLYFAMSNKRKGLVIEIVALIKANLNNPATRGPCSEALLRQLHHPKIKEIVKMTNLQFDLALVKKLGEEELLNLFLYITGLEVNGGRQSINEGNLQSHENAFEILRLFVEMCKLSPARDEYAQYEKAVCKYARTRWIEGMAGSPSSTIPSRGVFDAKLKKHFTYLISEIRASTKHSDALYNLGLFFRNTSDEEYDAIYRYLRDPESIALSELAGCEAARKMILEQMESARPEVKSTYLMDELVEKSFPELQGKGNDPLFRALRAAMRMALNENRDQSVNLSQMHRLSVDQIRITKDVLANTCSNTHFVNTFRTIYEVDQIEFEDRIGEELALIRSQDPSIPQGVFSFIESLSRYSGKDAGKILDKLIIDHAIGAEERAKVLELLTQNEVIKTAFESHRNSLHDDVVRSLRRFPAADALAKEFIAAFTIPLPNQTPSEIALCTAVLGDIIQVVNREELKESEDAVRLLTRHFKMSNYPGDFVVQTCLLFLREDVQEWFDKREVDWMPEVLETVFRENFKPFDRVMEIKLFLSLVKAKNLLSDQAFDFLDGLFDVLHEVGEDKIMRWLKTGTNIFMLPEEDIDAIKSLLDDQSCTKVLTLGDMPGKIQSLRSAFDRIKPAAEIPASDLMMLTQ